MHRQLQGTREPTAEPGSRGKGLLKAASGLRFRDSCEVGDSAHSTGDHAEDAAKVQFLHEHIPQPRCAASCQASADLYSS